MIPQDHHEENYSSRSTQIFIPRVLPNQQHRFETEEFFRKSAQTSEVMYQKVITQLFMSFRTKLRSGHSV